MIKCSQNSCIFTKQKNGIIRIQFANIIKLIILLITAEELKNVAMQFAAAHQTDNDPLPLGIFKQNGRFDPDLIVL